MTIAAWTAPGVSYPEYLNVTLDGDDVIVTMRTAAVQVEGVRVCGVSCRPGSEHCNNYCNSAPEKGPMQDRPLLHTFDREGYTSQIRMPASVFCTFGELILEGMSK